MTDLLCNIFKATQHCQMPNQLHVWGGCHPHRVSNHAWPLLATSSSL